VLAEHTLRRQQLQQQAQAEAQAAQARAEARRQEEQAKAQRLCARGCYYAVSLSNPEAQASFSLRCGTVESFKAVQHATVCNGGFFIGRDNGKSYWHNLPPGLTERLVEENLNTQGALRYVAAGSDDSYYAQLTNGTTWWSTSGLNDSDSFDAAMRTNQAISRVEFGEGGCWVILYGDGGYTFGSGLPTKIYNKLRSRNQHLPAPVEVSLGPGDTWFVRYADGKTDWTLPSHISELCNKVCGEGGEVISVSMCADSSDYMIRSTVHISI
jgi:hypothetical protein